MTHYDEMLAHLIAMARNPATKGHAWHRAQEMAACQSGLWIGMDAELKARMSASPSPDQQSAKAGPASAKPASTPASTPLRKR